MCHDKDILSPGHGSAIMLLSSKDGPNAHPFWYAKVLGAFVITVDYWEFNNAHPPKIWLHPLRPGCCLWLY